MQQTRRLRQIHTRSIFLWTGGNDFGERIRIGEFRTGIGDIIVPLLQLLERHPITYFGDPGAIVHFIERFNPEYEDYLVESLKRTPTITTIWMLNRCINGRDIQKS